jgi:hypothetical protein
MSGNKKSGRRSAASLRDNRPEFSSRQMPWTLEEVHLYRWFYVRQALAKGERMVDDSAYDYAAAAVADTPARGGAGTMKKSYDWVQKRPRLKGRGPLGHFFELFGV